MISSTGTVQMRALENYISKKFKVIIDFWVNFWLQTILCIYEFCEFYELFMRFSESFSFNLNKLKVHRMIYGANRKILTNICIEIYLLIH